MKLALSFGGPPIKPPGDLPHGGLTNLSTIIQNGVNILLIVASILAIIFIALAGFDWIRSGGDKTKLAAARAKLTWAIVGLVIAFVAFTIIRLIGNFFNTPLG